MTTAVSGQSVTLQSVYKKETPPPQGPNGLKDVIKNVTLGSVSDNLAKEIEEQLKRFIGVHYLNVPANMESYISLHTELMKFAGTEFNNDPAAMLLFLLNFEEIVRTTPCNIPERNNALAPLVLGIFINILKIPSSDIPYDDRFDLVVFLSDSILCIWRRQNLANRSMYRPIPR